MPTPRQMDQFAVAVGTQGSPTPEPGPAEALPPEYWQALLRAAEADRGRLTPNGAAPAAVLSRISCPVLQVGCRRCGRVVEIERTDAIRLYGPEATWREVGRRLLDKTCTQRTGRHEEDGCWPTFG